MALDQRRQPALEVRLAPSGAERLGQLRQAVQRFVVGGTGAALQCGVDRPPVAVSVLRHARQMVCALGAAPGILGFPGAAFPFEACTTRRLDSLFNSGDATALRSCRSGLLGPLPVQKVAPDGTLRVMGPALNQQAQRASHRPGALGLQPGVDSR